MTVSEFLEKYENDSEFKQSVILDLEKHRVDFRKKNFKSIENKLSNYLNI